MPHVLPPLPYAYNALEPHIDEQTMRLHHDMHHKAYVDGLNAAERSSRRREKRRLLRRRPCSARWAFHGSGHFQSLHLLGEHGTQGRRHSVRRSG